MNPGVKSRSGANKLQRSFFSLLLLSSSSPGTLPLLSFLLHNLGLKDPIRRSELCIQSRASESFSSPNLIPQTSPSAYQPKSLACYQLRNPLGYARARYDATMNRPGSRTLGGNFVVEGTRSGLGEGRTTMEWKSKGTEILGMKTDCCSSTPKKNLCTLDSFESNEISALANSSIPRQRSSLSRHRSISSFFYRRARR